MNQIRVEKRIQHEGGAKEKMDDEMQQANIDLLGTNKVIGIWKDIILYR